MFILLLVFGQKLRVNSDNQQADNFYALSDYNRAINESEERNDEIWKRECNYIRYWKFSVRDNRGELWRKKPKAQ